METAVILKLIDLAVILGGSYMRYQGSAAENNKTVDELLTIRNQLIKGEITSTEAQAEISNIEQDVLRSLDTSISALPKPTRGMS